MTPKDLPEWAYIYCIETSTHDPDVLYLSATRYKLDDYRPYLCKSIDGGRNWENICGNYPENEISRVIREDPKNYGLLFVGSETGIFFSHNDGANWNRLGGNFPVVPVYDLKIKDNEMVVDAENNHASEMFARVICMQMGTKSEIALSIMTLICPRS